MKFGFFDDARREYVITTPRTPLPWINYLGSEDFFTLLSNTAGGYSFYRDARLRRLTRYRYNNAPLDQEGFHIYIKDGETVWNPGWQPAQTELDRYECRHGLGYSIIEGAKDGVEVRQELMVPLGENCLLMRVTVKNDSGADKALKLFPYLEFCLWDAMDDASNFQRNYSTGEVEVVGAAIYHKTEYRERRDHYAVFWRQPRAARGRLRRRLHRQRDPWLAAHRRAGVRPGAQVRREREHPLRPRLYRKPAGREVGGPGRRQQDPRRGHDRPLRRRYLL